MFVLCGLELGNGVSCAGGVSRDRRSVNSLQSALSEASECGNEERTGVEDWQES